MWLDVVPDCGPNIAASPLLLRNALQTMCEKRRKKRRKKLKAPTGMSLSVVIPFQIVLFTTRLASQL